MPITYDITKDGLFLEGMKKGEKKGEKRGFILTAENLLKRGMSIQEVSEITTLSIEELTKLAQKLSLPPRGKK